MVTLYKAFLSSLLPSVFVVGGGGDGGGSQSHSRIFSPSQFALPCWEMRLSAGHVGHVPCLQSDGVSCGGRLSWQVCPAPTPKPNTKQTASCFPPSRLPEVFSPHVFPWICEFLGHFILWCGSVCHSFEQGTLPFTFQRSYLPVLRVLYETIVPFPCQNFGCFDFIPPSIKSHQAPLLSRKQLPLEMPFSFFFP